MTLRHDEGPDTPRTGLPRVDPPEIEGMPANDFAELPTPLALLKAIRNVGDEVSRLNRSQEQADLDRGAMLGELAHVSHRVEVVERTTAATHRMMVAMSQQQQLPPIPVPPVPARSISPQPMRLKLESISDFDKELAEAQVRRVGRTVIDARGKLMWSAILAFVSTIAAGFGGYAVSEAKHQPAPIVAPLSHQ